MPREKFARLELAKFILCRSFYFMVALLFIEAMLTAATTYLIIKAGRDVANDDFLTGDLIWILVAQSAAYIIGAISWIFAERAGFGAFGNYMQRFARDNRHQTKLLHEKATREVVEPFLTGETFYIFFQLIYELEADLKLAFHLVFNTIVLGSEIDTSFPVAYGLAFVALIVLQVSAAQAGGARLSRKSAHDQPDDRAGLHRVGQRVQPATATICGSGSPASRRGCATRCARRSGRS